MFVTDLAFQQARLMSGQKWRVFGNMHNMKLFLKFDEEWPELGRSLFMNKKLVISKSLGNFEKIEAMFPRK